MDNTHLQHQMGDKTFEKHLNDTLSAATATTNSALNIEEINNFCNLVRSNKDGSRIAAILIAKKLNSDNEWEILQTINILKLCAEKCGPSFHREIGMFRFLNTLIKLIFPKYLGNLTSEKVKTEICKLLYDWSLMNINEPKIKEAYNMLKEQNLIPLDNMNNCKPCINKPTLKIDENISNKLKRLLKNGSPDDIQEANRLIKALVKEDEIQCQMKLARNNELELINSNMELLNEMLSSTSNQTKTLDEYELLKELYNTCKRSRLKIVKMLEEIDDDSEYKIAELVGIYEEIDKCIETYDEFLKQDNRNPVPISINSTASSSNHICHLEPTAAIRKETILNHEPLLINSELVKEVAKDQNNILIHEESLTMSPALDKPQLEINDCDLLSAPNNYNDEHGSRQNFDIAHKNVDTKADDLLLNQSANEDLLLSGINFGTSDFTESLSSFNNTKSFSVACTPMLPVHSQFSNSNLVPINQKSTSSSAISTAIFMPQSNNNNKDLTWKTKSACNNYTKVMTDIDATLANHLFKQSLSPQTTLNDLAAKHNDCGAGDDDLITTTTDAKYLKNSREQLTKTADEDDFQQRFNDYLIPEGDLKIDGSYKPVTLFDKDQMKIIVTKIRNPLGAEILIPADEKQKVLNNIMHVYSLLFISLNNNPIDSVQLTIQPPPPHQYLYKVLTKIVSREETFKLDAFNPILPPPSKSILLYIAKYEKGMRMDDEVLLKNGPNNSTNLRFDLSYVILGTKITNSLIVSQDELAL